MNNRRSMDLETYQRVVGVGAGGHAKVLIEALRLIGGVEIVGLLDVRRELWGSHILDVPVLGDDSLLEGLFAQGIASAFIGVGGSGDNAPRRRLFEHVTSQGFIVLRVIHPSSVVSPSASLGVGTSVLASAVVNAEAILGVDVIVNTGAVVEHDCVIGDHVHIATGARIAGGVTIGTASHIGIGASIRQGIRIGERVVVGAGAAVVWDLPDGVVVAGVPARAIRASRSSRRGEA